MLPTALHHIVLRNYNKPGLEHRDVAKRLKLGGGGGGGGGWGVGGFYLKFELQC